eukprot:2436-Prymnesium_polylepis.1
MGHRPSCVPVVSMNFRISGGGVGFGHVPHAERLFHSKTEMYPSAQGDPRHCRGASSTDDRRRDARGPRLPGIGSRERAARSRVVR